MKGKEIVGQKGAEAARGAAAWRYSKDREKTLESAEVAGSACGAAVVGDLVALGVEDDGALRAFAGAGRAEAGCMQEEV
jgi:hypothetical protein